MNRRNFEGLLIVIGIIAMLFAVGVIVNTIGHKPEVKPSCWDIEMNDEWYYEHGHDDWVKECRKVD